MAAMGIVLFAIPETILRVFTADETVIQSGIALLFIAALFQLFDGVQTVSTGALRGLGDTQTPMMANLIGYWVVGLPLSYWLCFHRHQGASGLWIGLCFAIVLIAGTLLATWARKAPISNRVPAVHAGTN